MFHPVTLTKSKFKYELFFHLHAMRHVHLLYSTDLPHTFPNPVDWNKVLRMPTEMDIIKLVTILCHF